MTLFVLVLELLAFSCLFITIQSLSGSHPFSRDSNPHGPSDISRFLASMGQVCVELLCCAADH